MRTREGQDGKVTENINYALFWQEKRKERASQDEAERNGGGTNDPA